MRLLVTAAWRDAQAHMDELKEMGHEVVWMRDERGPLPCDESEIEGVICNGLFQHHPLERFERLRYIQLTSAGYDRVPMDQIQARGIRIYNARGVYSIPMAEYALWGVLSLYKQGGFFLKNQALCRWEKHRGLRELYGKTVCIVGCGSVGTECARRFSSFGCRVQGVRTRAGVCADFDQVYTVQALDSLLPQADIVVLALPLTPQTAHLFDEKRLRAMKQGAILVNLSRGAVLDTQALIPALENSLGGAVLDVFEQEPLPSDSPLWKMENVLITPHNSFVGEGNDRRLAEVIMNNLSSFQR